MSIFYTEPTSYNYPIMKEPLPPSQLGYHSNNKYDNFPPLMSDGRTITASYQPDAVLNEQILKAVNVKTNWEYRKYMVDNAKNIMKFNCVQAANDAGYFKRYADLLTDSNTTPYVYNSTNKTEKPHGYQASDLKDLYISREELQANLVAPEITQEQLFKLRAQN